MMAEHRTIRTWRRRAAWAAAAATALAVAILAPAHAQSQRGTIAGQVVDTDGAPLPGVIAVAINPEATPTEPPRFAVTDRQGRYRIRGLQAGTWSVTFSLPGFGSAVRNDVEVQGSSTRVVDSELAPGVDADVPITIGPPRGTIRAPGGSVALECAYRPSGVVGDCRRVIVVPRVYP